MKARTRRLGIVAALALAAGSAGCRTAAELEQAAAEARRASCLEAGFTEGSDAYRLCLLLEETQERIARLERRIDFLDMELSRLWTWGELRRRP
ncbi:MAG: hypothetical protein K6T74_11925 [Geminicoccaceae bacterium]|nr:hypothetical protein [Geminicoccaceae bacterium]